MTLTTLTTNGLLAFFISIGAGFGINALNLPDLMLWQIVIIIAVLFFNKNSSWRKMGWTLALGQFIGLCFFSTNWSELYVFRQFPLPANAAILAITVCYSQEFILAVINRISGKK